MEWVVFVRKSQEISALLQKTKRKISSPPDNWRLCQSEMEGTECTRLCAKKEKIKMSEPFSWTIIRKWSGDKRTWRWCKMKHKRKLIWRQKWNYCGRLLKWGRFPGLLAQKGGNYLQGSVVLNCQRAHPATQAHAHAEGSKYVGESVQGQLNTEEQTCICLRIVEGPHCVWRSICAYGHKYTVHLSLAKVPA